MPEHGIEPLFNSEDMPIIQWALRLAAETRLTDVCQTLGLSTIDAGNFRDRCQQLLDAVSNAE